MKRHRHSHEPADADPMQGRFVPLADAPRGHPIYRASLASFALLGAAMGGLVLGWTAFNVVEGPLAIAGLGQFAAAGWGVATFTGAGVGAALGGLAGGLVALYRMPPAPRHEAHRIRDSDADSSG